MRIQKIYIIEAATADLKEWRLLTWTPNKPDDKHFDIIRKIYPEYEFFHMVEFDRSKIIRSY